ncbi:Uma2 family endonuclease [Lyngbya confervoides]|uniref:Uma2 family endonuclease n=1 Tax=Lyngbya confervoides BDU141951 TaxID=1574623 RepID=A0ABD4T685_9CYAN|nr:Uma2 family endonuclease [Lyngbya confervoides]MCM1983966.1 Uma2 family endonuclease [Lyngbya confervoides BDU141951]
MIASPSFLTPEEYFDWEAAQPERHEYFDGATYAMAGGTLAHGRIGLNISAFLNAQVRSRQCLTFNSDCRVGISEAGPFTYPDVSVSCDERDRTAQQFIQHPCLIVEVLSASTEAYDRGRKFELYRQLPSLQEYMLVGSETKTVELFRRDEAGAWRFFVYGEGHEVTLASVGVTLSVDQIYADVAIAPLGGVQLLS